jgi:hypothetical protein
MVDQVVKRTVGRPPRDIIDSLRGIYWFKELARRSNKNAYHLEKQFSADKFKKNIDGLVERPCQWNKYASGKHLPSRPLQEKVEAAYPGSSNLLNLPVWDLLRQRAPSDEKLQVIMSNIKPNMTKYIGKPPKELGIRVSVKRLDFFLNTPLEEVLMKQDIMLRKFTGLLILIIDSKNKGDEYLLKASIHSAILLIPFIVDMFFNSIRDDFYDAFKNRFVSNNERFELELSILRVETPFLNLSLLKDRPAYPPKEYFLIRDKFTVIN